MFLDISRQDEQLNIASIPYMYDRDIRRNRAHQEICHGTIPTTQEIMKW